MLTLADKLRSGANHAGRTLIVRPATIVLEFIDNVETTLDTFNSSVRDRTQRARFKQDITHQEACHKMNLDIREALIQYGEREAKLVSQAAALGESGLKDLKDRLGLFPQVLPVKPKHRGQ